MKNLKKLIIFTLILSLCAISLASCEIMRLIFIDKNDYTVWLDMNTDFKTVDDTLPSVEGEPLKVILLLGQSNASGASICEYLRDGVGDEKYAEYEAGYENILINFCVDNGNNTSDGEFRAVNTECGAAEGFFGPELGMAERLSEAYPDERIVILKYTMSGYSLNYDWLCRGERGSIYNAFLTFVNTYMTYLSDKGYDARIGAICWMQGESDTTEYKSERYYDNTVRFVSYLRSDLSEYAREGGIYFIDAGISNSPYCEPSYPEINAAKVKFSETSELNIYFSTIDLGYTIDKEPVGEPDLGHYDALCELDLGYMFAERIIEIYGE